jgi:hypothetical protein
MAAGGHLMSLLTGLGYEVEEINVGHELPLRKHAHAAETGSGNESRREGMMPGRRTFLMVW